ncbi:hypothetical protein BH10ACT5_BH10ACT5_05520 [soil metagenome]
MVALAGGPIGAYEISRGPCAVSISQCWLGPPADDEICDDAQRDRFGGQEPTRPVPYGYGKPSSVGLGRVFCIRDGLRCSRVYPGGGLRVQRNDPVQSILFCFNPRQVPPGSCGRLVRLGVLTRIDHEGHSDACRRDEKAKDASRVPYSIVRENWCNHEDSHRCDQRSACHRNACDYRSVDPLWRRVRLRTVVPHSDEPSARAGQAESASRRARHQNVRDGAASQPNGELSTTAGMPGADTIMSNGPSPVAAEARPNDSH